MQVEDYIEINCIEDLVDLSIESSKGNRYEGKNIVLLKNLDFNDDSCYDKPSRTDYKDLNKDGNEQTLKEELTSGEGFTPISYFSGNFYGQGFEIRNIYINSSTDDVGIFRIASKAKIRDLGVTGVIKTSKEYGRAGGIAGTIYNTSIINCYNIAELEGESVGGIVGEAGGITGSAFRRLGASCEISYCHNASDILGNCKGSIGGIVGQCRGINLTISNCYNTGNFEISEADENVKFVGGIIGTENDNDSVKIEKCYNAGNIQYTGDKTDIGGILGGSISEDGKLKETEIFECYNMGNIVASGDVDVGGIVGSGLDFYILNCYNKGKIEVENSSTHTKVVSGLVGESITDNNEGKVINSYNQGNILVTISNTGSTFITGICQTFPKNSTDEYFLTGIGNCYNVGSISCVGESGHCAEIDGINSAWKWKQEQVNNIKKCYYLDSSNNSAFGSDEVLSEEAIAMSKEEMKDSSFVTTLNNNRDYVYNELLEGEYNLLDWEQGEDGYPTLNIKIDTTTPIYIKNLDSKMYEQDGIIYECNSKTKKAKVIRVDIGKISSTTVELPEYVTVDDDMYYVNEIESKAFSNCRGYVEYVVMSEEIEKIADDAFDEVRDAITIVIYSDYGRGDGVKPSVTYSEYQKEYAEKQHMQYMGLVEYMHRFTFSKDNYAFLNNGKSFSSYSIGDLKNYLDNTRRGVAEWYEEYMEWNGSCTGMELTATLFKFGVLTQSFWDLSLDEEKQYDTYEITPIEKGNDRVMWLINFYMIFQNRIKENGTTEVVKTRNLKEFYEKLKEFYDNSDFTYEPLEFSWVVAQGEKKLGNHCCLIIGKPYELPDDFYEHHSGEFKEYKYRIPIHDPNKAEKQYIYISEDFSKVREGDDESLEYDVKSGLFEVISVNKFERYKFLNIEKYIKEGKK